MTPGSLSEGPVGLAAPTSPTPVHEARSGELPGKR
jgi:hypothetical protein